MSRMSCSKSGFAFSLFIGAAAACILIPTTLAAARAPERAGIPYSTQALMALGSQRVFEGDSLKEIAFPLGGIGTGTVSLGGRGNLRDWEIFNRPGKGVNLPFTFFALYFEDGPAGPPSAFSKVR